METRHVKLGYEEALNAKKQILSAELNLLQTAKRVRNYKILRKKELTTKIKLKTGLKALKTKLNALKLTFPKEEEEIEDTVLRSKLIEEFKNDLTNKSKKWIIQENLI